MLMYSTQAYESMLAQVAAKSAAATLGKCERKAFPDGESYLRFTTPMRGEDVVLLGGTINDANTMELYRMACGIGDCEARSLVVVVPYFGCQTMEREQKDKEGEIVTAKVQARLLSSIPAPPMGIKVVMIDLHSDGIPYYFEAPVRAKHLYAEPVMLEAIAAIGKLEPEPLVIGAADVNRVKWARALARKAGLDSGGTLKDRKSGSETETLISFGPVDGAHVLIFDDMIRMGSTALGAAEGFRERGAKKCSMLATHGVFPKDSLQIFEKSGLFERVWVTDTHPNANAQKATNPEFYRVLPIARIIANYLFADV